MGGSNPPNPSPLSVRHCLCSLHFSANCFVGFSAGRRRLIPGSVPSIFFSYLQEAQLMLTNLRDG